MTQAMTDGFNPVADVTLSGRELAMQRRQAMARFGKVGAGKTASIGKTVAVARTAAHVVPPTQAVQAVQALQAEAVQVMPPAPASQADVAQAQPSDVVARSMSAAMNAPSGRALAQARRNVLSREGKSGLKRVAQAVKIAAVQPEQNWQAAIAQNATGRQIAMQHRMVRSLIGRAGDPNAAAASRPAGRMRPAVAKGEAPVKVEEGHTLSGQRVTGTMVERSKLVTGNESGAVRAITGTEYIGAEQFERQGVPRPQGGPPKVAVSETAKGKTVTGALPGRSPKVTGDEVGATRALTGTAYLGAAAPAAAPEKVALTHTARGKSVTGTLVGHGATRMTGDERGICAKVTGTEYLSAEQLYAECALEPQAGPAKVTLSTTSGSQSVSGAAVGRSPRVTGDEPGSCRPITGSQYYNSNDFSALCVAPGPRRASSVMSLPTPRQQLVSDREVGLPKFVGDAGREAACATAHHPFGLNELNRPMLRPAVAVIPAIAVTGDRPGAGGSAMTGDARGVCLPVSGTPYLGEDNTPQYCASQDRPFSVSGRFLGRAQPDRQEVLPPPPLDFSISSPARSARERSESSITGTASGNGHNGHNGYNDRNDRITGPINKAGGLITGTPDFRHRIATARADEGETAVPAALRLSGAGQTSAHVTGDAWQSRTRVTGTEGASALVRNPSQRGAARAVGVVGAREMRDIERQSVPESRVTGSSGNTTRGALVTVSGGARA